MKISLIFSINIITLISASPAISKQSLTALTTLDIIRSEGYEAEEHTVITKDGYLLAMHRIPKPMGAPTVFLQHGIFSNSFDWIVTGKNNALAFILADRGYDVWMGNARGSIYSKRHLIYKTSQPRFWNFSWHEMGVYDLPAEITYITNLRKDNLIYVGHSMGTTMFYVMAIERPDIANKVKAMFSLAPVAFISESKSPLFRLAPNTQQLQAFSNLFGMHQLLPQRSGSRKLLARSCEIFLPYSDFCLRTMYSFVGYKPPQVNYTHLPMIWSHFPSSGSMKTVLHYIQINKSGKFRRYDYGSARNLKIYNNTVPPDYDISKIQVPIGIFWSDNDYLSNSEDIQKLYNQLPKKIIIYKIPSSKFSHSDHLWGINAPKLLYSKLLPIMDRYR